MKNYLARHQLKLNRIYALCWFSLCGALVSFSPQADALASSQTDNNSKPSYITIIIDDIGYKQGDQRFTQLPEAISFAILPHAQYSYELGLVSGQQGRDVMLHLPLESIIPSEQLGVGALMANMDYHELTHAFSSALASVPNVIGINNHMGSKFTQLSGPLDALMGLVAQRDLFFVDSRTTPFTKVEQIAQDKGVETARRHVFLDHIMSADFIEGQFQRLIRKAKKNGHALAIGHPHDKTYEFLLNHLPLLKQHNIELVGIKEYLYLTNQRYAQTETSTEMNSQPPSKNNPQIAPQP